MRVERFFLFFPPEAGQHQERGDRVRDRDDPARWLREDHRDEPRGAGGGGSAGRDRRGTRHARGTARAGWRARPGRTPERAREAQPRRDQARLLQPAGLEADRGHRGGPGDEPADRLPRPLRSRARPTAPDVTRGRHRRAGHARRGRAEAGRSDRFCRRRASHERRGPAEHWRSDRPRGRHRQAGEQPHVRWRCEERLPRHDVGDLCRQARRQARHGPAHPLLRRERPGDQRRRKGPLPGRIRISGGRLR